MRNLNQLFVFTNSRKIREFNAGFNDELIPKSLSIAEFYKKAIFVNGRFECDSTYALVLMNRACASVKEANSVLKIPTEFFEFLKNNDYLFSFFKELAISKKSIEEIKFNDIYADFEEHLSILEAVLKEYESLLDKEDLYDDITLPKIYSINEAYIRSFSEISLHIDGILSEFEWEILEKISNGLKKENLEYSGVLFIGFMIDEDAKVLEFNVRFGDPETEVVLPRMESDLLLAIEKSLDGSLEREDLKWKKEKCLTVILTSRGYPKNYEKGKEISGIDSVDKDIYVYHNNTKVNGSKILTDGGRVLSVTALGNSYDEIREKVYRNIEKISFETKQYRKDIGKM